MTLTETEEVEAPEEEDLTSKHETAPKQAAAPAAKEYQCPHCDKVYAKGLDRNKAKF